MRVKSCGGIGDNGMTQHRAHFLAKPHHGFAEQAATLQKVMITLRHCLQQA